MTQPVIVIGMHRSGTSMLTKILQEAGVFMGVDKDQNDESTFFQDFNDWMLKQANANWDNPYCFNFVNNTYKNHVKRVYDKRQKSFFAIKYFGVRNYLKYRAINNIDFRWGWKDPKNTFTIDIWKKIYPKTKILHIYRNPVDVTQSLKVRAEEVEKKFNHNVNKNIKEFLLKGKVGYTDSYRVFSLSAGFELWKEYLIKALNETEALHIKYEDLLINPKDNLSEIFQFIDLSISNEKLKNASDKFDSDRRYAFLRNEKLTSFYKTIINDDIVKRLKYDNLML